MLIQYQIILKMKQIEKQPKKCPNDDSYICGSCGVHMTFGNGLEPSVLCYSCSKDNETD